MGATNQVVSGAAESDLRAYERQVDKSESLSNRIALEVSRRQNSYEYRQSAFGDLMAADRDDWLQAWNGLFGSAFEKRYARIAMNLHINAYIQSVVEKEFAEQGA